MALTQMQERLNVTAADFEKLVVVCPAGRKLDSGTEGPACRCQIEESLLTAAKDPVSLASFCCGQYTACPTWRQDQQHRYARPLLDTLDRQVKEKQAKKMGTVLDEERVRRFTV